MQLDVLTFLASARPCDPMDLTYWGLLPIHILAAFIVIIAQLLLHVLGPYAVLPLLPLLTLQVFGATVLETLLGVVGRLLEGQVGTGVRHLFYL